MPSKYKRIPKDTPFYIYGLKDPITNIIRYIGMTQRKTKRLREHIFYNNGSNPHKDAWITILLKQQKKPEFVLLEETTEKLWEEREKYWIKKFREDGVKLTNITEGGISPAPKTKEGRERIRKACLNRPKEFYDFMRNKEPWNKGKKLGKEWAEIRRIKCKEIWDELSEDEKKNRIKHLRGLKRKNSSSKFYGVSWSKKDKVWRVRIWHNSKEICLGYSKDEIIAAKIYNEKAPKYLGDNFKPNVI